MLVNKKKNTCKFFYLITLNQNCDFIKSNQGNILFCVCVVFYFFISRTGRKLSLLCIVTHYLSKNPKRWHAGVFNVRNVNVNVKNEKINLIKPNFHESAIISEWQIIKIMRVIVQPLHSFGFYF